jgi:hypothetical protein
MRNLAIWKLNQIKELLPLPPQKRFKSCSETELDKISQTRNEKNTDKQPGAYNYLEVLISLEIIGVNF